MFVRDKLCSALDVFFNKKNYPGPMYNKRSSHKQIQNVCQSLLGERSLAVIWRDAVINFWRRRPTKRDLIIPNIWLGILFVSAKIGRIMESANNRGVWENISSCCQKKLKTHSNEDMNLFPSMVHSKDTWIWRMLSLELSPASPPCLPHAIYQLSVHCRLSFSYNGLHISLHNIQKFICALWDKTWKQLLLMKSKRLSTTLPGKLTKTDWTEKFKTMLSNHEII